MDHKYHQAGNFFAVWAKTAKEAEKIANRWASDSDSLAIVGSYKTMKACEKAAKSRGPKYKHSTVSFAVRDGSLMSIKDAKNLNESFKVNSPTLDKLVNMEYVDPRQKDGCKIVAEKCGKLNDSDGSYIMYQDNALPGKYVAVHVSDDMNEETDSANVKVIAIGTSKKNVKERMAYRIRRNNA